MKAKLSLLLGGSLIAAAMVTGTAQSREFADIYTECGLGAMIAPKNAAVAAVTNVTWDLGTTAISSDASSEENCKGGQVAAASFIHESYATLENDIAKGDGRYIASVLNMMNCDASAQPQLKQQLRGEFSNMLGEQGYSSRSQFEKSEALYNMINLQTQSCRV